MKIGIDISKMNKLNKGRGVGYYTENLVEALQKFTDLEIRVIEDGDKNEIDVVHYPYFDLYSPSLPLKKIKPTVVTIHDVTPLVFKEHYPAGLRGSLNLARQKIALKNINAVITDSESAKKDIKKLLGVDETKIYPIYLSQADRFKVISNQTRLEKTKQKYNLPDIFCLFIGNVNWNKNINGLTEAAIKAGLDLFLVGSSFTKRESLDHPEMKSFQTFLNRFENHPQVHILGFVEDEEVVDLLNLATIFLFPSFYEGFGMPVLEAQACGTPVITSNISSLPEVAGDSALLVNPHNTEEIVAALRKLVSDKVLKEKLIKNGLENIKRFSWKKCAIETAEIYRKVYEASN